MSSPCQPLPSNDLPCLDTRHLEPPEPFVQTMDALSGMKTGGRLRLLFSREPHPLYRVLQQNGYRYRCELRPEGFFAIEVWQE